MNWVEGTGEGLPCGTLAWVEHPVHGVVWAEKNYYTYKEPDAPEATRWYWIAFGLGEAFLIEEVMRFQVVTKPGSASEDWVTRAELIAALRAAETDTQHCFGIVSNAPCAIRFHLEKKP